MNYLLAIDAGTTSNRAILFDEDAQVISVAQKPFRQFFPHPGWVEQDPAEILATTVGVCAEAIAQAQIDRKDIVALGITNQRETTILWDKKMGRALAPAIVWQCRRTADRAEAIKRAGYGEVIRKKTGLEVDAYFSATKIAYLLDTVEGAREKAEKGEVLFGTVDSFLLYHLTGGVHRTDMSNASRTMLFNIHDLDWDEELLDLFRIPRACLPEVLPTAAHFGDTLAELFGTSIPVTGMIGDQQAALFGEQCFEAGEVKSTFGTGAFVLMNTGHDPIISEHGLLSSYAWDVGDGPVYAMEGSIFACGSVIEWLKEDLELIEKAEETAALAESVGGANPLLFVPAFTGLGTPYWDPEARGTLFGITRATKKAHLVKAALDAIAYMTADVVDAMEKDLKASHDRILVDGGVSHNDYLMTALADTIHRSVHRPALVETTALGAAFMAGIGCGLYQDLSDIKKRASKAHIIFPTGADRSAERRRWKKAVAVTMANHMD
ncbi:MAG: glycerol kinase GlpK [Peptoniphilus sp.]|nr:glycerol kinase GlpK [Peptoniphilus sp.]MDY3118235.1 glycerol kinase GlpK [Peptoniphilus sp.]